MIQHILIKKDCSLIGIFNTTYITYRQRVPQPRPHRIPYMQEEEQPEDYDNSSLFHTFLKAYYIFQIEPCIQVFMDNIYFKSYKHQQHLNGKIKMRSSEAERWCYIDKGSELILQHVQVYDYDYCAIETNINASVQISNCIFQGRGTTLDLRQSSRKIKLTNNILKTNGHYPGYYAGGCISIGGKNDPVQSLNIYCENNQFFSSWYPIGDSTNYHLQCHHLYEISDNNQWFKTDNCSIHNNEKPKSINGIRSKLDVYTHTHNIKLLIKAVSEALRHQYCSNCQNPTMQKEEIWECEISWCLYSICVTCYNDIDSKK